MKSETLKFPDGFKWGSTTSAHQVEGGNNNDWTVWEKSPERIAQLKKEGKDPSDFISGKACDSYNRYEEDFDIAKNLNQNIHRFSIEWSRIEPEEGKFDERELEHYKRLIDALRERGIEPMITLWHFTNPIWFANKGGWLSKRAPEYFTRYAKYVVENIENLSVDNRHRKSVRVKLWITFNEAFTVYAGFTKLSATWPSRGRGVFNFFKMRRNIFKAHILAYREIKKIATASNVAQCWVGITENNVYIPDAKGFWRKWMRGLYRQLRNFYFLPQNTPYYDFIGLNYYHISRRPKFNRKHEIVPKQEMMTEMNWEIYPEGIYHVLKDLKKFNKPIFITENGVADGADQLREKFIREHLRWVWKSIQDGVDVRGYLYWSLLDNFEWHLGFKPRFGLVEMDYATLERKIRPSAHEYAKICLTNQLEVDSPLLADS